MTTAIKRRRGTTTQHSTFTGLEGELTVDTTKDTVVVHDGSTAGGFPLAKESQATTNVAITGGSISGITDLAVADGGTGASTAGDARTNLGVTATGADTTYAFRANNLSDLASASTARTNLGLGTIATQAASSVAITGGSINGTTIGATTASTGAFTTLSATGVATFSAGTVSAPAITTTGDTNTGIFFPAADTIAFTEGGVESMRIDSSGNIGLGSTPKAWSTIKSIDMLGGGASETASFASGFGSTYVVNNAYYNGTSWIANTTSVPTYYSQISGTHQWHTGTSVTAGTATSFSERMRIDSSGNVGIGRTNPGFKLDIQVAAGGNGLNVTDAATSDFAIIPGVSSGVVRVGSSAGAMALYTNNGERVRIDTSGNVGIGTSSISVPSGFSRFVAIGDSDTGIGQISDGVLAFATNNTEKVRIDANGNFLVGTTAASYNFSGRGLIEVNGSSESLIAFKIGGSTTNAVYQYNTTLGFETNVTGSRICYWSTNGSERMRIDSSGVLLVACTAIPTNGVGGISLSSPATSNGMLLGTTGTGATNMIRFYNPNGNVGAITTSGSATTYATSSDYRLKENVEPMTGALATVAQLKPVTYNWKVNGSSGQGFIAHELQAVVPDCVTGEKDAVGEDGKPRYQGIDTSFLVATLTASIQELKAIVDAQALRITALESN